MFKSPDAFRTISEVADWLGIQAHVLRFWESKFTQVKPIKRAGGRRYYRPGDMLLLGGIKRLLHDDGLTIKGVQKILREEGMSHVAALSIPLDDADVEVSATPKPQAPKPKHEPVVVPFEPVRDAQSKPVSDNSEPEGSVRAPQLASDNSTSETAHADAEPTDALRPAQSDTPDEQTREQPLSTAQEGDAHSSPSQDAEQQMAPEDEHAPQDHQPVPPEKTPQIAQDDTDRHAVMSEPAQIEDTSAAVVATQEASTQSEYTDQEVAADTPTPAPLHDEETLPLAVREAETTQQETDAQAQSVEPNEPASLAMSPLPSFLDKPAFEEKRPVQDNPPAEPSSQPEQQQTDASDAQTAVKKPRDIGMPAVMEEQDIHAEISTLTRAMRIRALDAETVEKIQPLLAQLSSLRNRMATHRGGTPANS